jgi:predicted nucleotidyltransferase component of viral defense system
MSLAKNRGESVRRRLLDGARLRGDNFNLVLTRYAIERLLYRLGQSSHRDHFILKGAALYSIWTAQSTAMAYRPTRDLDFWGSGSPAAEDIVATLREVLQVAVEDDGLEFLVDTIEGQAMREDAQYEGCRLHVEARLVSARIRIQIDFGFGDAITPAAQVEPYPTLLTDLPAPQLRVYPRETVVAEKFEALVSLGVLNTRMKDFFDLWTLSEHFNFNGELLQAAIIATFTQRQTGYPSQVPPALMTAFTSDPAKIAAWQSFGRRSEISDLPKLEEVALRLSEFLMPITIAILEGELWSKHWSASSGWQSSELSKS